FNKIWKLRRTSKLISEIIDRLYANIIRQNYEWNLVIWPKTIIEPNEDIKFILKGMKTENGNLFLIFRPKITGSAIFRHNEPSRNLNFSFWGNRVQGTKRSIEYVSSELSESQILRKNNYQIAIEKMMTQESSTLVKIEEFIVKEIRILVNEHFLDITDV
ncbi:10580_t:CDS:2, partial [Ambispora leptoticha]